MNETILRFGCFNTKPSAKKRRALTGDDNQRRTEEIACFLTKLFSPAEGPPAVICAEGFLYHRGIVASAKVGLAWGCLITLAHAQQIPLVSASPQDIKRAVTDSQKASKEEVQSGILARYGNALESQLEGVPEGNHEHAYDAIGAIVACLPTDVVRLSRQSSRIVLGLDMGFAHIGWAVARLNP